MLPGQGCAAGVVDLAQLFLLLGILHLADEVSGHVEQINVFRLVQALGDLGEGRGRRVATQLFTLAS